MSTRSTFFWLAAAIALFGFIFLYQRHARHSDAGPARILANLKPELVTTMQILPRGESEIRVEKTNQAWRLTEPLSYAAQSSRIDHLLNVLQQLRPATHITDDELAAHSNVDDEFGFADPQATIVIKQGDFRIRLGKKTAPGDQLFVKVSGTDGIYVVDADLLKAVPRSAGDWREVAVLNLDGISFDRLAVTNTGKESFVLQRDATNHLWRIVHPPGGARADESKIGAALEALKALRISQFVSDDPKTDLEPLGLQPPDLEVALAQGTNTVARLQFGKNPTNDARQVYGRSYPQNTIFTVATNLLASWRVSANEFRDQHILVLTGPIDTIEIKGRDSFSLSRQTNENWRILPQNLPADADLVKELLATFNGMRVLPAKDIVAEPDLPGYGLASPLCQYAFLGPSGRPGSSNNVIARLSFGTNQAGEVFVRRTDEFAVYGVKSNDFSRLPLASWQLRERRIWNFSTNDIAGATIRQHGKTRQILRKGPYQWSLAPGSQGSIDNVLAVEETVRGVAQLSAAAWVARGEQNRARYGFSTDPFELALDLKTGGKVSVQFGGEAPGGFPYASVKLDDDVWIFEFPLKLCRDVLAYLSIPLNTP